MRIVKSQQDFVVVRHAGVLAKVVLDQVEDYFNQLGFELSEKSGSESFLYSNNYIAVVKSGDNVRNLKISMSFRITEQISKNKGSSDCRYSRESLFKYRAL